DVGPGSPDPITKDVFSLWIDHGANPQNGTYAYVVAPADDAAQAASAASNLPVEIVANTPKLQAVWHKDLKMAQAAFHAPGRVTAGSITISVDRPCLLLLRRDGDKLRVAVSNPANEAATVGVTVGGTRTSVELPGGLDAGKSVVREFPLAN
ncbi:MAG TPA: polysaccharide lyase beta-sandwich domain-containing protein, partial [Armatimonadaceae bacterium]|nr:polysaccharide lyase beta-sandwich domain-containing protein [Armatimonadaceae bacterium]